MSAAGLGGFGYGFVYVSGLCYIHVRTKSQHRIQRSALCHLSLVIGTASAVHRLSYEIFWRNSSVVFGHFLTYSSGSILLIIALNELLQGLKVYDYKKCLEPAMDIGNLNKDNFDAALIPPMVPPNSLQKPAKMKQFGLSVMMILSKGINGMMYSNIFLIFTLASQSTLIRVDFIFVKHYFLLGGLVLGIIVSLSIKNRFMLPISLVGSGISLLVASIFMESTSMGTAAVFFWSFYFLAGMGYFVPDVGLMELSSIQTYEMSFALGLMVEQIPIMLTISYVNMRSTIYVSSLWVNTGLYLGFGLAMCALIIAFYPNVYQKTVLRIQHIILYDFDRTSGIVFTPGVFPNIQDPNTQTQTMETGPSSFNNPQETTTLPMYQPPYRPQQPMYSTQPQQPMYPLQQHQPMYPQQQQHQMYPMQQPPVYQMQQPQLYQVAQHPQNMTPVYPHTGAIIVAATLKDSSPIASHQQHPSGKRLNFVPSPTAPEQTPSPIDTDQPVWQTHQQPPAYNNIDEKL